ncbi:MAG: alpha/beta hydrolase [Gammaproteobacteria bacterium]|nr:alpha/beta hydrolase [Gammaproteobacteria bacterium]
MREAAFRFDTGTTEIAGYAHDTGTGPVGIFVHGFRSDCQGEKATALAEHAIARRYSWVRFDLAGHGASGGRFPAERLSTWLANLRALANRYAPRPLLLVGSSLGAWLAVLLARERPAVGGLVLLAPAFNFLQRGYAALPPGLQDRWRAEGRLELPDPYGLPGATYELEYGLIEDAAHHDVLSAPVSVRCPVVIIHGRDDELVPLAIGETFFGQLCAPHKELVVVPAGDHRLTVALPEILSAVDRVWSRL